jgi:phospholipid transport system substrate-binding protein
MRSRPRLRFALLLFAATLFGATVVPCSAQDGAADPAVGRIRSFYDALLETMKDAKRLGMEGRYEKLAPTIRATFDFAAMMRIAVGPQWSSIPPEQQAQLIEGFARMTIATYAHRFDGYAGERFEVEPTSEVRDIGRIVHTKLVPANGQPVTLNYLMRASDDKWKIVDVYLEGTISELATRRAEFAAILKAGGVSDLIDSLRRQAEKQMHPGPKS